MIRLVCFLFSFVVATTPPIAVAGDEPTSVRFNVVVDVDPTRVEAFETAWKTIRDQLEEDGYPYYSVVSERQNQRHLVSVINDYAGLIAVHNYFADYNDSEDREIAEAVDVIAKSVRSLSSFMTIYDDQLSYVPPNSYAGPFHELKQLHFDVEDRAQVKALLAQQHALWAAAGIPHAFHVMWNSIGAGLSSVTVMTSATDLATHQATFQSVEVSLDREKNTALKDKLDAVVKSQHVVTWTARTDLRLFPHVMRKE